MGNGGIQTWVNIATRIVPQSAPDHWVKVSHCNPVVVDNTNRKFPHDDLISIIHNLSSPLLDRDKSDSISPLWESVANDFPSPGFYLDQCFLLIFHGLPCLKHIIIDSANMVQLWFLGFWLGLTIHMLDDNLRALIIHVFKIAMSSDWVDYSVLTYEYIHASPATHKTFNKLVLGYDSSKLRSNADHFFTNIILA